MNSTTQGPYPLAPVTKNQQGAIRKVGFELEFSGLSLAQTIATVKAVYACEEISSTAAECKLEAAALGRFGIEIDWRLLKQLAAERESLKVPLDLVNQLSEIAALLVPVEVVCPPIAMDQLDQLDTLISALREAGAVGTEESLIAAYGVHINAEIPQLNSDNLLAYLQAFSLLQYWLMDAQGVDLARRISPYIDLYPEAYVATILQQQQVDVAQIVQDYLQHNPSRNRALDMLPLLSLIAEDQVQAAVEDPRIGKRPTFHYRLPDCHIEKPSWSLQESWRGWLVVERLASDSGARQALTQAYLEASVPVLGVSRNNWVEWLDLWLHDHAWV